MMVVENSDLNNSVTLRVTIQCDRCSNSRQFDHILEPGEIVEWFDVIKLEVLHL